MPVLWSNVQLYVQLPILILIVSLIYSATRFDEWSEIWKETGRWAFRMISFLGTIGVFLYIASTYL